MDKLLRSFLIIGLVILAVPAIYSQTTPVAPAGSGESHNPYLIYTLEELYWISRNPEESIGKYYQQMTDIDASATVNWNGGQGWEPIGNNDNPFYGRYDGQGYTISGLYINRQENHQGLFGMAYASYASISNLGLVNVNITGGDRYTGALAGLIYGTVDNCYSTGKVSGKGDVGGLLGHAMLVNVSESYSSARVNGDNRVGGLAGSLRNGIIENSYSEGPVNYIDLAGDGMHLGGLVGFSQSSTIKRSFSTSNVYGNDDTGGLIGYNWSMSDSLVIDSYSTGKVTGSSNVGGLVGRINYGAFINCYSTGIVSGNSVTGGLVAEISNDVSIEHCYWDTETSGQPTSEGGEGKTTAEMIDVNTFGEWDFTETWEIMTGQTYPFLKWESGPGVHNNPALFGVTLVADLPQGGTVDGEGEFEAGANVSVTATVENQYYFVNWTDEQDNVVSTEVSYQFTMPPHNLLLTANFAPITLSVEIHPVGAGGTVSIDPEQPLYNEGEQVTLTAETQEAWIFINWTDEEQNELSDQESFVYTMPGHAVTLSANFEHLFSGGEGTTEEPWLIETAEDLDNIRQFLGASHADKHFRLVADINLDTEPWNTGQGWVPIGLDKIDQFQGTLDGDGKKITGLFIEQPTSGGLPSGAGLFETLDGAVVKNLAIEDADIFGSMRAGALAAIARNSTLIMNCYSSGTVTISYEASDVLAGGLVGENRDSEITGSNSSATVNGYVRVGGLVGANIQGAINDSYSTGTVEGRGSVGGLSGRNENGQISGSFSTGSVTGTSLGIGGLVGQNTGENAEIINCYSVSRVKGESYIGGLVGNNTSSAAVRNSYSTGSIYGWGWSLYIGGLIGRSGDNEIVENSFWDIETSGQEESAGGDGATGYTTGFMTSSDLYVSGGGWDFDQVWDIVANNTYPFHKWQAEPGAHNYPPEFFTLTLETDPEEAGDVDEEKDYPAGGYVPVSVTPNEGFRFDRWVDDTDQELSTDPEFVYTMAERNVTLTAQFTPVNLTVTVIPPGSGTVDISPVKDYYDIGDEVTLTATSEDGYKFTGWADEEDNALGTENMLVYTIDQEITVLTANFVQEFAGGSGTEADPWMIETAEHLDNVRNYLGEAHGDKHFLQVADIDLDVAPYNEGTGWDPIGTGWASLFHGTYNGEGYIISGLYINLPDVGSVGLFNYLQNGARIENLSLTGVNITGGDNVGGLAGNIYNAVVINFSVAGTVEGNNRVGILAGLTSNSHIENCSTTGSLSGNGDVGGLVGLVSGNGGEILYCHSEADVNGNGFNVGGLLGLAGEYTYENPLVQGSSSTGNVSNNSQMTGGLVGRNNGTIQESYSTSEVTGGGWFVGGLVGYLDQGSVTGSYSTGSVTSTRSDESYAGGLIGLVSNSTVDNSYSTGDVAGDRRVGGLTGQMTGGSITGSYSTGKVEGNENTGGLVGLNQSGTVDNSYWNTETSWQTESAAGEGRTTVEMLKTASFDGWNFVDLWNITDGATYPFLQWQTEPDSHNYPALFNLTISVSPAGAGTIEGDGPRPGGGLIELSAHPDGGVVFFEWTDDQDNVLSSEDSFLFEMPEEDVTINAKFEVRFAGGQGTEEEPWLIETAEHLDNIRLYLEWENGDKHFRQVADIDLGTSPWNEGEGWEPIGISWESFYGTYDGNGLIIDGLYISRPGSNNVGLFGYLQSAEIIGANIVNASVAGSQNVGIIAGNLGDYSRLIGSISSGEVEGWRNVGGLVGNSFDNSAIEYSYSSAGVVGTGNNVGGLAGSSIYGSVITESFSTGYAVGNNYVGGLVGSSGENSVIENSYSTAGVAGSSHVGGLAGEFTGASVQYSYSTGIASGEDNVGGLAGSGNAAAISDSYWNTESSRQETSAGGEGKTTAEMISAATFTGWDFAGTWDIEEGETYPWLEWQQEAAGHNYPADLYSLTLIADPEDGGTVEGGGVFPERGLVLLHATPESVFNFEGWQDEEGNLLSEKADFAYTMPSSDVTLKAVFSPRTVTVEIHPEDGGTVSMDPEKDAYEQFENVLLIATANEGYEFVEWTDENGVVMGSYTDLYYHMLEQSVTITANFAPVDYTLTVSVNPEGSGTVTVDPERGHYNMGDEITLTATPGGNDDYVFVNWTDTEDNEVSDQASFVYTMPAEDTSLKANFDITNIVIDPSAGGLTVSPVPASDYIVVEADMLIRELRIIDISGQVVMHVDVNGQTKELGVVSLSSGIYLLQIELEPDGDVVTRRVVISR